VVSGEQLLCELDTLLVPLDTLVLKRNNLLLEVSNGLSLELKVEGKDCRMDLPGPTTSVGTRTDYSVGPWDYPACATRHLMVWSTTTEEKYSVRKLYMSFTVWKTPRRTRLVLSPYSDL
jgi:hypothetical protein